MLDSCLQITGQFGQKTVHVGRSWVLGAGVGDELFLTLYSVINLPCNNPHALLIAEKTLTPQTTEYVHEQRAVSKYVLFPF